MPPSVTTRSYDLARSGATDNETVLSASALRQHGIVKLFSMQIADDPRLEAQPLAVGNLRMADGHTHDVIFQASMGNTVYAFDAQSGAPLWHTKLGRPITGSRDIDQWLINVAWGILSTPVIDEAAGILYACAWISDDGKPANGQHFLAALRLADGSLAKRLLNLESAVYNAPGLPQQRFRSAQRKQRAALTLVQGQVLVPFGSIQETAQSARGWLIAVDTAQWRISATWCSTVTESGGGLWQSGAGPAVAPDGSIFVITGNGSFDPAKGDYGESIVKLRLPGDGSGRLSVASWWSPWTDEQRTGRAEGFAVGLPSNVQMSRVKGHARRLATAMPDMPYIEGDVRALHRRDNDAVAKALIDAHMAAMGGDDWGDQDFGSGGPVCAAAANAILAAGKDGILYTANLAALGDTQIASLAPATTAANYAKLRFQPILYTYYDPAIDPAPQQPTALNRFSGNKTRHLHGGPVLWRSAVHGWMHFVGGENSPLRAWTLDANGTSTYQAGSNESASPLATNEHGGMPGWSIMVAANQGADGIVVALVPYRDANMGLSPGRFLVYDAQNFATNPDGSQRLQVLWDSENWGPEHGFTHPKFNRPIVWNGRIYRPTYDGRLDVYGLTR
jgi:hypothetical protein